ncbi:MAG TPA: hypothetical protein VGQ52_01685 [Gemmatimonadaceae bacterium]|nr:hypothetical protein [Gemmatimonadaceae bacterium]
MKSNRWQLWASPAVVLAAIIEVASTLQVAAASDNTTYSSVLDDCGRKDRGSVLFFSAFGGLWPLPSNFVLLDSANRRLEYSDRAFPWEERKEQSVVFFGPKQRLEESWPGVFSQAVQVQSGLCGVEVRQYRASPEFGKPVVVVSSRYDHLLLVGPIAASVSNAMQCFSLTKRQVGYPC